MATRLAVLDPDPGVIEVFRRAGEAAGCDIISRSRADQPGHEDADVAIVAPDAFASPQARRAYLEACERDSVLLLVGGDADLEPVTDDERDRVAGFAVKPVGPTLAAAHVAIMRRRHQDRLRREAALCAIPDLIFRMDGECRYLECHPRDSDVFVRAPEDFLGRRARDVMPESVAAPTERAIARCLRTGAPQTFKYELEVPSGELRYYEARLAMSGPDEIVTIVRDVTDITRASAELERAAEMRQALASKILHIQEAERHRIARELHDAIGQMLLVHKLDAEWIRTRATSIELQRAGVTLSRGLEETLDMVRALARGLRPPALDDLGLGPALEALAGDMARHGACEVSVDVDVTTADLSPEPAITLYRIAQEALANSVKHADCRTIRVALEHADGGAIELRVDDDGVGISDAAARSRRSLGLLGMHERAALHGGDVSIAAREGGGTSVVARIPHAMEGA